LAVEVAVGTTATSGKSSPADCAPGAGEPDLGRGAHRSRTSGEAMDLGFAPNGAGVLPQDIDPREAVEEYPHSTGGRLSAITPRPSWPRNCCKVQATVGLVTLLSRKKLAPAVFRPSFPNPNPVGVRRSMRTIKAHITIPCATMMTHFWEHSR
jgi:hypothetical protein